MSINKKKEVFNDKYEYEKPQNDALPLQSINGRRCLSKCYPAREEYFHPVILTGVRDKTNNTCAIQPIPSKNPDYYREHEMIYADICRLEDNSIYKQPNELESILLSFYFNPRDFLVSIYNLRSFDEVIYWTLENDHLPFDTVLRVHNCAWKVFGSSVEELTTNVLEYYYDICKTYWVKDYIPSIEKNYSFDNVSNSDSEADTTANDEISNIILNILTYEFFVKIIHKYVYEYQDKWDLLDSQYSHIKKYVYRQLVGHINKIQDKKN